jgi:hypothetical protein
MLSETVRSFGLAELKIKVVGAPMQSSNRAIFQLDIWRSRFAEYFRIWPGGRDNGFSVLDAHRDLRQVVLAVKEPRRPYEEKVLQWGDRTRESVDREARAAGGEVVRDTGRHWVIRLWTPEQERRYLCGFDERTLFMAQVPEGNTVLEAHKALMPDEVARLRAEEPASVVRQGEWFFLTALQDEVERMREYLPSHPRSFRREEAIDEGGQPHVADELARVDRRERRRGREIRHLDVYVRGRIRHADHHEVVFAKWQRSVRNRAVIPAGPDRQRLRWID